MGLQCPANCDGYTRATIILWILATEPPMTLSAVTVLGLYFTTEN